MKTRILYGVIALIIILIVALFIYNQSTEKELSTAQTESQSLPVDPNPDLANNLDQPIIEGEEDLQQGQFTDESDILAPDIVVHKVVFNGQTYEPFSLDIKLGDIVLFTNNSDIDFWPASAFHPTHKLYPEFDPKQAIAPGKNYEFKFTRVGEWRYHDHLSPAALGIINVTQ